MERKTVTEETKQKISSTIITYYQKLDSVYYTVPWDKEKVGFFKVGRENKVERWKYGERHF